MRGLVCTFILCLASFRMAVAADWFCEEGAAKRIGNMYSACGIGVGSDENEARISAFNNSKKEFTTFCQSSSDCQTGKVILNPQRTSCGMRKNGTFKCYRMVEFKFAIKELRQPSAANTGIGAVVHWTEAELEDSESFAPFSYEKIKDLPKIKRGMEKTEVLKLFGKPARVSEYGNNEIVIVYEREKFCESSGCTVKMKWDSVSEYGGFKYEYTESLKTKGFWDRVSEAGKR